MRTIAMCIVVLLLMAPAYQLTFSGDHQRTTMAGETEVVSDGSIPPRKMLDNRWVDTLVDRFRPPEGELAVWYLAFEGSRRTSSAGPSETLPTDSDERAIHKANEARGLGYTGADVRVAVVDTGLDFAQPELAGRQARVLDNSPYFLHPIVYDPTSLNDYLLDGIIDEGRSWFVNTSYEASVRNSDSRLFVSFEVGSVNRTWDVTGLKEWEIGEKVRIGFHPDKKLEQIFGSKVGVLLFASIPGGAWDSVVADLDGDDDLWDEKVAFLNDNPQDVNATAELLYQDVNGDTVADISGGMVYFIADGVRELPYASRQIEVANFVWQTFLNNASFDIWQEVNATPADNLVPSNGSLVALFGDFGPPGVFGSHGTWVASALAGQGGVDRGGLGPNLTGMAPGVELMAAGNLWGGDPLGLPWQTALMFVSEGYDGAIGTGDEAHIASNSWGSRAFTGWSWSCRLVDYLSSVHSQNQTVYVFAAGNSGWGYGGLQCPGGATSVVTAGASTNMFYRDDPWFAFDAGPNPTFGDIASFSNRGPSALGTQYVDVLANGLFGYGAEPLNNYYAQTGEANGTAAWLLWAGTSLATPNTAGILSLIYESYNATHGSFPDAVTAKTLIMASADDLGNDPFNQGAGVVNALRGVELAGDVRGVLPYAYELVPGDYRGKSYPSFARILNVGDFNTTSLRLTNVGDESLTVTLNASTLNVTSSASHAFSVNFTAPAAEFILNATGLFNLNGTVLLSMPAGAFQQADVLRISIFTELDSMLLDAEYLLEVMDWTDVDGDSVFDGVEERNRIVTDWVVNTDLRGPNGRQFIHRPVERTHDGLYIWLRPINQGSLNQMSAVLQLDFMRREPFPWIDVSPSTHVLAAQQTKEFSVNTTVPQDASSGIYQSALLIDWETNTTTVPITLSVATDVLPLEIGGPRTFGTYDGGLVYGAGWKDDPGSGDFRYFYLDLGEEPAETLSLAINWTSNDTWVEAYALSPTEDWFSDHLPQRYGDYALGLTGANRLPHGRGITLQMNLTQGLNLLVIRSVFVSGAALSENFSLNVLSASLTPAFITGQGVPVDGVLNLTLVADTSLPQLEVVGRGFSKPIIVEEESIAVGELKEYSFSIKLGGYIEVVTDGTDDLDIDLLLWYMHPILSWIVVGSSGLTGPEERIFATLPPDGPYVLQVFAFSALEGSRFNMSVDFVQGAGVMPRTPPESLTSGQPQDLRVDYRLPHFGGAFRGVVLAGLSSNPDLAMAFVEFEADLPPVFSNLQVPPGSFINDPSPVLSLDMDDAPDDHYTGVNVSSVNVQVDGLDFTGAAEITAYSVRLEVPVVLTDGTHTARVTAKDLAGNENATSWNFTVDTVSPGLQVESLPGMINSTLISLKGSVEVGALLFVQDMPWGYDSQGNFTANIVLVEGAQIIVVRAVDLAGNEAVLTFEVTVDTQPPSLQIEEPLDGDVTTEAMIAVRGTTESGSILTVNGLRLDVGPDGLFDARIGLEAGLNTLRFAARDVAGNEATAVIRITFNPPEESLRTELEETMAELNATRNELETLREELNSTQGEINQTRRDLEAAQRELRLLIGTLSAAVVASLLVLAVGAGVVVFVLYLIFVRRGRLGPPRRF